MNLYSSRSFLELFHGLLEERALTEKAVKGEFSRVMQIQNSYLSAILQGKVLPAPEQWERLLRHLDFTSEQRNFCLLFLLEERAGSPELKKHFAAQRRDLQEKNLQTEKRVDFVRMENERQKEVYYSSWLYSAVHIALTIPELQTKKALAGALSLDLLEVEEALELLKSMRLVEEKNGRLRVTSEKLLLEAGAPLVWQHHLNWRLKTIESFRKRRKDNLHFSAVASLSPEDVERIKEIFRQANVKAWKVVETSPAKKLYSLAFDFFELN